MVGKVGKRQWVRRLHVTPIYVKAGKLAGRLAVYPHLQARTPEHYPTCHAAPCKEHFC